MGDHKRGLPVSVKTTHRSGKLDVLFFIGLVTSTQNYANSNN